MKTRAERVQAMLTDPGERVHAAVPAFRLGGVRSEMRTFRGAAPGAAVLGALLTRGQAIPADAPTPGLPNQLVVALTDRRLLIYAIGGTGISKPKKLVREVARADITGLEQPAETGGVFTVLRVGVLLRDGTALRFEFPRLQIADGSHLIEELGRDLPPA